MFTISRAESSSIKYKRLLGRIVEGGKMKLSSGVGVILVASLALYGCGGESKEATPSKGATPTKAVQSDRLHYKVFNLVYQGKEVNSFTYQPLNFSLTHEDATVGEDRNTTGLPNYMFVEGDVMFVSEADKNAFDSVNYTLNYEGESKTLASGSFPVQFEAGKSNMLVFVNGDTTSVPENYRVTAVKEPDLIKEPGRFPVYFMNNSSEPVKLELYYDGALFSDATQNHIDKHSISNRIMLDAAEPNAQLKIMDSKGNETVCSIGEKDVIDRKEHAWLLAVSPFLYKGTTINNCQPYSL
ncbi:hypothetical protein JCM19236_6629 [Vibrio sp. JCM 19236]|nr:hypothetical protein JCM19236_6629 [Vibrio sp. JCM 19236]